MKSEEYKKHFQNALNNYIPVLNTIDDLEKKYPDGMNQKFPDGWTDPFELYGCFASELESSKDAERQEINKLLETHSPFRPFCFERGI